VGWGRQWRTAAIGRFAPMRPYWASEMKHIINLVICRPLCSTDVQVPQLREGASMASCACGMQFALANTQY